MRTISTSLEKVINHVNTVSATHYDEMVPVHEMQFDNLKRIWISGQTCGGSSYGSDVIFKPFEDSLLLPVKVSPRAPG